MEELGPLTLSYLYVLEGHLGSRVADQHLPVEGEHDVHVRQVDHAAHHVARHPLATERLVAHVPALGLGRSKVKGQRDRESSKQFRCLIQTFCMSTYTNLKLV